MINSNLKHELYLLCLKCIEQKISNAQSAIDSATESANDDTKSSAGDKHETGRAMAQLEQEKSRHQLKEALDLKTSIEKINLEIKSTSAHVGSIIITDKGNFFILVPVGKLLFDEKSYYAISIASPIGAKLTNLTKNDSFDMNGIVYKILEVL